MYISIISGLTALWICIELIRTDNRIFLLPNRLVLSLFLLAWPFHYGLDWFILSPLSMVYATVITLFLMGLFWYVTERLMPGGFGMGDVKLLAAAGAWLGIPDIFLSIALGGICVCIHGVLRYDPHQGAWFKQRVPAGPGLIIGFLMVMIYRLVYTFF
jgi:leader peptidase (prepilin peptidase) / N-methyltransferase